MTSRTPPPDDSTVDAAANTAAEAVTTDAATPTGSRKRRTLIVGLAVGLTLALVTTGGVAAVVHQQNVAEEARLATIAAEDAYQAEQLATATALATTLATDTGSIVAALADTEVEGVDTDELAALLDALTAPHQDRKAAHSTTFAAVQAVNDTIRVVLAHGRTVLGSSVLAEAGKKTALANAIQALSGAPRGLPTSYRDHGELIAAVLAAAVDAAASQEAAVILAAEQSAQAGGSPGGTGGTRTGAGTSSGGNTTGGGSGGGSSPAPHPRAELCASLGFANNLACLDNYPTYVATNSHYVPLSSCNDPGAYGSHTPGFGGTSRPSYTFPWSYRIDYASSGLGTVKFFLCD